MNEWGKVVTPPRAIEQALKANLSTWYDPGGGAPDLGAAARIAVDALASAEAVQDMTSYLRAAAGERRRLQGRVRRLERLAEAVSALTVHDFSVYEQVPGSEWVAVDREDYLAVLRALAEVDCWRPWETVLERRLPV